MTLRIIYGAFSKIYEAFAADFVDGGYDAEERHEDEARRYESPAVEDCARLHCCSDVDFVMRYKCIELWLVKVAFLLLGYKDFMLAFY